MKPFSLKSQGYFLLICLAVLNAALSACNQRSLAIPDYIEYVRSPENGLINSVEGRGYRFTALYEPADYVTLKELRNEKITSESFTATHKKFSDYFYFDFSITPEEDKTKILDEADTSSYEKRFHYFAFELSKDVILVSNSDTLHCLMHQFAGDNKVSPEYHFALMFDQPDRKFLASDTLRLIYNDELLNAGKISVPILTKKITNLPQLKI